MTTWLSMGGYAFYVWSAYAAAAALLGGFLVYSVQQKKRVVKDFDHAQS